MKKILVIFSLLLTGLCGRSQEVALPLTSVIEFADFSKADFNFSQKLALKILKSDRAQENPRLMAILITVALGPFGAHRIYLGTDVKVPVFYTLTLGGGLGILPVIDLLHLIFTKDISRYYDNNRIFMWSGN